MSEPVTHLNAALERRYVIERKLGEGGMATVYLGDDLRHERKVALKILRPELAAVVGAERFLAEIKTTANLKHPHILPLFDSGEVDGFLFYVMPYVEEESLRHKLSREHQLPVEEAVSIASKVATALDYAHRRGVIHRDIKPANILLEDGEPVVGDFGIARAVSTAGGHRLTETGLSLGTPHYMSPEQATGDQQVGPATDIWALGCVLYEMLVGEPPYTGSTPQAILGKIITGEPESVTVQRSVVPAHVEAVIAKTLQKVPADRFGRAQELADALKDEAFRYGTHAPVQEMTRVPWRRLAVGFAAGATLATLVALAWPRSRPTAAAFAPMVVRIPTLADNQRLPSRFEFGPAGTGLVYEGPDLPGDGGGRSGFRIWYRGWDDPAGMPVAVGSGLQVSPDGSMMATLVPATGELTFVSLPQGAVWNAGVRASHAPLWGGDGYVYVTGLDSAIYRIRETGEGQAEPVGIERREGEYHVGLWPVAGGPTAVLEIHFEGGRAQIDRVDIETGERTFLINGCCPRPMSTGHLIYGTDDRRLMAATLNRRTLDLGSGVVIAQDLGARYPDLGAGFSVAADGSVFGYWTSEGGEASSHELVWVARTGVASPVDPSWAFDGGGGNVSWMLSPDETRVAVTVGDGPEREVWIKELEEGLFRRLTFWEGEDRDPHWMSDSVMTFVSTMAGTGERDVWRRRTDGSGRPELVYDHDGNIAKAFLSPDGAWLVARVTGFAGGLGDRDILAMRLGVDSVARPLIATSEYTEHGPTLSPDGRWLAYSTNRTGRDEVIVQPFPDVDAGRWQVSVNGGMSPVWSRDGTELFYLNANREVVAARISTEPSFRVIGQEVLFTLGPEYDGTAVVPFADVTSDGRFLMRRSIEEQASIVLIYNFSEWLKARVPN